MDKKVLYSLDYHGNSPFYHKAVGTDADFTVSVFWFDPSDQTWQTYYDHVSDWPMTMGDYLGLDDLVDKSVFDKGVQKLLDHITLKDKE